MSSFFGKLKSGTSTTSPNASSSPSKKDAAAVGPTPLERMLVNAGPIRNDGSDKFWGMENFGNTCYCNSILQCLYYSGPFRENILSYPRKSLADEVNTAAKTATPRPPLGAQANGAAKKPGQPPPPKGNQQQPQKPEDKDSPEYKKKQALLAGPMLNMSYQNAGGYDMSESLFTSLKDIFEGVVLNQQRSGVVSPSRFLEVLRKENEMFRSAMHQDAHEFLNLLLNAVMENIEAHDKIVEENKKIEPVESENPFADPTEKPDGTVSFPDVLPAPGPGSAAKWLHELFEGTLTSETRCLTCENTSQRDEPFLDLSVDLEQHSSVTSCLRRFSEEEMLCERNKFHCDNCGGLQEAEKRMKIKRLPKILALHLKRFKYTEDLQRLQKLFHKVVYPYHLRLFNTTDDAEDPDRLYELYAVVVHIGGGPYHGHYVAIIKTQDRGWLLFDDEMVEPVDKSYVRNFFGDKAGLACAYVLFYQETTLEAVQKEQRMEGKRRASQDGTVGLGVNGTDDSAELHRVVSDPTTAHLNPESSGYSSLAHAATAPPLKPGVNGHVEQPPPLPKSPTINHNITPMSGPAVSSSSAPTANIDLARPTSPIPQNQNQQTPQIPIAQPPQPIQSKKEKAREEKALEKARKHAEKQAEKERVEAEKEKRKSLANRLGEAQKKQEADFKAALEASKMSKAEEDSRRVDGDKENEPLGQADSSFGQVNGTSYSIVGTGNGPPASPGPVNAASGLDRFRRSKSLRFASLSKKDKDTVKSPSTVPESRPEAGKGLTRSATHGDFGAGESESTTALVDDDTPLKEMSNGADTGKEKEKEKEREVGGGGLLGGMLGGGKDKDKGSEKGEKKRFSIRKKSFGMLS